MLLRTVVLLLLCVSTGMCATIGHFQAQAQEEEDTPVDPAAITEGDVAAASVDTTEEAVIPADTQVGDSPAAEEPAANSIIGDNLLAKIHAVDDSAADNPEVDVPVANGATQEEPETVSDSPAGDAPAMEDLTGEAVTQEQPPSSSQAEEDNEIRPVQTNESLKEAQEEPETVSDSPAGDAPAMEDLTGEAVTQEQPSTSSQAEEDNEIRPVQTNESLKEAQEDDNSWGFGSVRNSFQTMHGYFESLVELTGGRDGVCQYRCKYGALPEPRPGYQLQEPNGCSTSLVGFQVNAAMDLGIPAMTNCCNQLDVCYDTCGTSKEQCDTEFRSCLHGICADLKSSLGYVSKGQGCESMADAVHGTVGTLGCRPYMNSQRAACVCKGEEKDEL